MFREPPPQKSASDRLPLIRGRLHVGPVLTFARLYEILIPDEEGTEGFVLAGDVMTRGDDARLRARFVDNAQDMVLACDCQGRITYANRAAGRFLGVPSRALIGKPLLDGVEELSRPLAEDLFESSISGEGWHGEMLLQRPDGRILPAYVSASPIRDRNGNVERVLVIAHDISERRKYEDEIRKKADLAGSIIRAAPIGIFTVDCNRVIRSVNRAFARMLGLAGPHTYLDQPFELIAKYLNPDLVAVISAGLEGRESSAHNRPLMADSKSELTVSLTAVPLLDPQGSVESVLVLVENRTELVKVEEQLLQAERLASTGFLATGIAHEIRNPLASISTVVGMLASRAKQDGGDEGSYERVVANINRIEDILRRLLNFANPLRITPHETDLNSLAVQIVDFFKLHPMFRQIRVQWDLEKDLPLVVVDPRQIQLIFHNLAMNAAQAMKETGGTLAITSRKITRMTGDDETEWVEFRVRDTGPGIPEENLPNIFKPFFTTKPQGEGTGLGLSVSLSIARNHGGELIAQNHPEGGAEFILRLPVGH